MFRLSNSLPLLKAMGKVRHNPDHRTAMKSQVMTLVQANDFARAKAMSADLCRQYSKDPEAWFLYGSICGQLGELDDAARHFRKSIDLMPNAPAVHYNLGVVQQHLGLHEHAAESLRTAISLNPNLAEAHLELGNVIYAQGQHDRAIACYTHALRLRPTYTAAHIHLGNAHYASGNIAAAVGNYTRAAQLAPEMADVYYRLGLCAAAEGRTDDEISMFSKAADLAPMHADAINNLGLAFKKAGKASAAISAFRRIISICPEYYRAYSNLGMTLQEAGDLDEAEACLEEAVRLRPEIAESHYNLGGLLYFRNAISKSERAYRKAIELSPDLQAAHVNLGNLLLRQARHHEAITHFRKAVAINPDFIEAQSNILFALNYLDDTTPHAVWTEHRAFGERITRKYSLARAQPDSDASTARPLRIGYVSADFRLHATAYFLEPLLERHDRQNFQIYCYANQTIRDRVTERFRSHAEHWRDIHGLTDETAAKQIMEDGIDILVDLSGHTHGGRMGLFAMKPAPVQVTWLGYINTSGLDAMDYRIVDHMACPPGMFDHFHTETLLRMPHTQWCYKPPEEATAVESSPAKRNGYVTFASVGNTAKITDSMLAAWLDILAATPESRLLMIGNSLEYRQDLINELASERAVAVDRIEYIPEQSFPDYLALHHRIDVNLDTFPYCGGATTCHSLWMGVPVITRTGDYVVSRGSASILHAVGLDDLATKSSSEYIEAAARLAGDVDRLSRLRCDLRHRMEASPLTDAGLFTLEMEKLYRAIWTTWCNTY